MGNSSQLSYLGITSSAPGVLHVPRTPDYPKLMIIPHTELSSCRCQWEKKLAMPIRKLVGCIESLQGFYFFALSGPLSEKNVTGGDSQSENRLTYMSNAHILAGGAIKGRGRHHISQKLQTKAGHLEDRVFQLEARFWEYC